MRYCCYSGPWNTSHLAIAAKSSASIDFLFSKIHNYPGSSSIKVSILILYSSRDNEIKECQIIFTEGK